MSSFHLRLPAALLLALGLNQGVAKAGDLEDCNSAVAAKIETGCTAIINDTTEPVDDGTKAYVNRSRLMAARAKLDLALADAEAAMQLNPKSVTALLAHSYALERSRKLDAALADLNQAIEIEPKNPILLASRGNVKGDQKNWADALADLSQAIALRQDYAQAYVARARAYVETGQLDQALADLNTAISINPNVRAAFFWRGQAYRRKGDADHAIEDFSRAIVQSPQTEVGSYFARGQLFSARAIMPAPSPTSTRYWQSRRPVRRPRLPSSRSSRRSPCRRNWRGSTPDKPSRRRLPPRRLPHHHQPRCSRPRRLSLKRSRKRSNSWRSGGTPTP